MHKIVVSAMYKFVSLPNYEELRAPLLAQMQEHKIYGTLLLAREGINGTIAGSEVAVQHLHCWLANQPGLDGIDHKESWHDELPFKRAKVKLKKEIVTMGVENIDPNKVVEHIKPKEWNALISNEEVMLVIPEMSMRLK